MHSTSATVSSPDVSPRGQLSSPVNRPFWLACRGLLRGCLRPVLRLKGFTVEGASHLPAVRRATVVVANHAAFVDSVYFILAMPVRFVICGAKPRLFRNGRLRALMALANILRVDDPEQLIADGSELLARGEVLLIYPEMGRNPDAMGEFQPWAAQLALTAGAPIVPCYLYGTTRGHSGPVTLRVGPPLTPRTADEGASPPSAAALTAEIRVAIEGLMPESLVPSAATGGSGR